MIVASAISATKASSKHRAVADRVHVRLALDLLGGGARAHQAVEARARAAGDGDEQEREQRRRSCRRRRSPERRLLDLVAAEEDPDHAHRERRCRARSRRGSRAAAAAPTPAQRRDEAVGQDEQRPGASGRRPAGRDLWCRATTARTSPGTKITVSSQSGGLRKRWTKPITIASAEVHHARRGHRAARVEA